MNYNVFIIVSLIFLIILTEISVMLFEARYTTREKIRKSINIVVILGLVALLTLK